VAIAPMGRSYKSTACTELLPVGAGHARDRGPELVAIAPMGRSYKSTACTELLPVGAGHARDKGLGLVEIAPILSSRTDFDWHQVYS
jgi:hypothetical protein